MFYFRHLKVSNEHANNQGTNQELPEGWVGDINIIIGSSSTTIIKPSAFLDALASLELTQVARSLGRWVIVSNSAR